MAHESTRKRLRVLVGLVPVTLSTPFGHIGCQAQPITTLLGARAHDASVLKLHPAIAVVASAEVSFHPPS